MALKFKPKQDHVEIDWIEGSKLIFKRPTAAEKSRLRSKTDDRTDEHDRAISYLRAYLSGWKGIDDSDSGKPLEFNEVNKVAIFEDFDSDMSKIGIEAKEKFNVFVGGILGN